MEGVEELLEVLFLVASCGVSLFLHYSQLTTEINTGLAK
jgi:hypothetical protein